MKNSLLKWYMFAFLFLGNLAVFAQTPDNDCGFPDCHVENDNDTNATPINGKLIYLSIVAIIFAYIYFKRNNQRNVNA
ncbi:hypothetical protein ACLI09_08385 [Flavobacterium sp. RHBU_24]|uniref:hypothetical protein n=1 Tax=Flavobacterium sp. RHBU_24 TaxID=3391185 RepID=UPI0039849417